MTHRRQQLIHSLPLSLVYAHSRHFDPHMKLVLSGKVPSPEMRINDVVAVMWIEHVLFGMKTNWTDVAVTIPNDAGIPKPEAYLRRSLENVKDSIGDIMGYNGRRYHSYTQSYSPCLTKYSYSFCLQEMRRLCLILFCPWTSSRRSSHSFLTSLGPTPWTCIAFPLRQLLIYYRMEGALKGNEMLIIILIE